MLAVALNGSISYFKAISSGALTAAAEEISLGLKLAINLILVHNEIGDAITLFQGTAYRKRGSLPGAGSCAEVHAEGYRGLRRIPEEGPRWPGSDGGHRRRTGSGFSTTERPCVLRPEWLPGTVFLSWSVAESLVYSGSSP
jgi:hypothetical protein